MQSEKSRDVTVKVVISDAGNYREFMTAVRAAAVFIERRVGKLQHTGQRRMPGFRRARGAESIAVLLEDPTEGG